MFPTYHYNLVFHQADLVTIHQNHHVLCPRKLDAGGRGNRVWSSVFVLYSNFESALLRKSQARDQLGQDVRTVAHKVDHLPVISFVMGIPTSVALAGSCKQASSVLFAKYSSKNEEQSK